MIFIINYIDKNTIDFIEYREKKKGIDLNLYLEMDNYSFLIIYNRTAKELNNLFNELVYLDRELGFLQDKGTLDYEDTLKYNEYTLLGQSYYERFNFLEEKIKILNVAKDNKNLNSFKDNSSSDDIHDNLFDLFDKNDEFDL